MKNKDLILTLVIIILIALSLGWYLIKTGEYEELSGSALCQREVEIALDDAKGRVCTAEFREMQCSHDDSFVYGAPHGCIIGDLEKLGWLSLVISVEEVLMIGDEEASSQ